jgi:hypothetical protein
MDNSIKWITTNGIPYSGVVETMAFLIPLYSTSDDDALLL